MLQYAPKNTPRAFSRRYIELYNKLLARLSSKRNKDGQYVAYGISAGGSEDATLYVLKTNTGEQIDQPINRVQYGLISWLDDGSGFY